MFFYCLEISVLLFLYCYIAALIKVLIPKNAANSVDIVFLIYDINWKYLKANAPIDMPFVTIEADKVY